MPVLINDEKLTVLNCTRLPARLNASQTAAVLGFEAHDIPVLIKAKLLSPLGKPTTNAIKFFAASDVLKLAEQQPWLAKATSAVYGNWKQQNCRRRSQTEEADLDADALVTTE